MNSSWGPTGRVLADYVADIRRLLSTYFPDPSKPPGELIAELQRLGINLDFSQVADRIAERMVTSVARGNARNWRQAAAKSSHGRLIRQALKEELTGRVGVTVRATIEENSRLISSLPRDIAREVANYVSERQQEGLRSEQIAIELQKKLPQLSMNRVRLIARTQTAAAETTLTQARSEELGIKYYIWDSAHDQRVRISHRFMDQIIVPWATPPSPEDLVGEPSYGHYHGGMTFNCRCVCLALIDLDEVAWPARIYVRSGVTRMSRAQFQGFAKFPVAA